MIEVLERLVRIDIDFSIVEFMPATEEGFSFEIKENHTEEEKILLAEALAHQIIEYARDDIAKNDKELNPDLDFARQIGFRKFLNFPKKKGRFEGSFGLGNGLTNVFNISFINVNGAADKHFDFIWYEKVLKCVIDYFDPDYSSLIFGNMKYYEMKEEVGMPVLAGWITYFKDGAEILVPDNMEGATVEQYKNGKLVVLSRDEADYYNLTAEQKRDVVLKIMKQLKQKE